MFKVNNKKDSQRHFDVFIVNLKHTKHINPSYRQRRTQPPGKINEMKTKE